MSRALLLMNKQDLRLFDFQFRVEQKHKDTSRGFMFMIHHTKR